MAATVERRVADRRVADTPVEHDRRLVKRRINERRRRNIKAGRHPREVLLTVPNEPLRERFLMLQAIGEAQASTLAKHMGWVRRSKGRDDQGDALLLKRTLGITPSVVDGTTYLKTNVEYETAERLRCLLGMDPTEAGT